MQETDSKQQELCRFAGADEYAEQCKATAVYPSQHSRAYLGLGVSGEAGEVAGKIKKLLRDGATWSPIQLEQHTLDIQAELGDVLWYVAMLCHEYQLKLSDVMEHNLAKLADRAARGVVRGSGDHR